MKIGIDADFVFEKAGVGRYSYNLIKNILKIDKKNKYFLYISYSRGYQLKKDFLLNLIKQTGSKRAKLITLPLTPGLKKIVLKLFSYKNLIKEPLDLYFSPHYSGLPKRGFPKMVVTVHDLAFLRFPELYEQSFKENLKNLKTIGELAKKIIVPSGATKKDIVDLLDIPSSKIVKIPEGVSDEFKPIKNGFFLLEKTAKYVPSGVQYFLSVGALEKRKNFSTLIKAFGELPNDLRKKYRIVIVGPRIDDESSLVKIIKNYNLADRVILTGFVGNSDLPYIYNRASLFIHPSLSEGFGLPCLEAMACGVPIIASKRSALPEVISNAGFLIDPGSEAEITNAIKKILSSRTMRKKLIERGFRQAKKFSWEKAATETIEVFNSA